MLLWRSEGLFWQFWEWLDRLMSSSSNFSEEGLIHWYHLADTNFLDEIDGISYDSFEHR
jgi:hypothetical protein